MRRSECVTVAQKYLELNDWKGVRAAINDDDILIIRSLSSRKRIGLEICKRLQNLNENELALLAESGDSSTEAALCWIAICRTYEFVRDFLDNVVAVRWAEGLGNLPQGSYETFYAEASLTHPELEKLSEGTRHRLRNQLFQMLREVDFVDGDDVLLAYLVPLSLDGCIDPGEHNYFPTATFVG